jgi:hypothetical protein
MLHVSELLEYRTQVALAEYPGLAQIFNGFRLKDRVL